ncbi:MAG TPA: hypothetical protein VIK99_01585 [Thermaerobacter sp.]
MGVSLLKGDHGEAMVFGVRELLVAKDRLVFTEDPDSLNPDRNSLDLWDRLRIGTESHRLDLPAEAAVVLPVGSSDLANAAHVETIEVIMAPELIVRVRFRDERNLVVAEDEDTGKIVIQDVPTVKRP